MFEFSLVFFNQHIFDKTNFKRIVHVIAKELNLIIAQKAITQECTKNKLGAELSVIDKNIASTDAGLPETKFLFSLFTEKKCSPSISFWSLGSWRINKSPIRSAFKSSLP